MSADPDGCLGGAVDRFVTGVFAGPGTRDRLPRDIAGYLDRLRRARRRYDTDPAYRARIDALAADISSTLAARDSRAAPETSASDGEA